MDLISRKSVAGKMARRRDYVGRPSDPDCIIADEPSVPAVPLEPLAKWIAENLDPRCGCSDCTKERVCCDCPMMTEQQVKEELTKWMEEQDAN